MTRKYEEMLMDICHEVFDMPRNCLVKGTFDVSRLEATFIIAGGHHTISKDWTLIRKETNEDEGEL